MEVKDILGELKAGIYVREGKYRFGCEVETGEGVENCYVASSAKLEQFLELKNRQVKLIKNLKDSKNKYTLWSVKYELGDIILELNRINLIIERLIKNENLLDNYYDKITRERTVENLKSDLLLENGQHTEIVEIKTVISLNPTALFPNLKTDRAVEQLKKIEVLLRKGYIVRYIIVALSPYIKKIRVNSEYKEYEKYYNRCIKLGMKELKIKLMYDKYSIKYEII